MFQKNQIPTQKCQGKWTSMYQELMSLRTFQSCVSHRQWQQLSLGSRGEYVLNVWVWLSLITEKEKRLTARVYLTAAWRVLVFYLLTGGFLFWVLGRSCWRFAHSWWSAAMTASCQRLRPGWLIHRNDFCHLFCKDDMLPWKPVFYCPCQREGTNPTLGGFSFMSPGPLCFPS